MNTTRIGGSKLSIPALVAALIVLAALIALPQLVPSFYVFVATRILILGLLATAFNLVFGYGGFPALGHAAFFGLGGYTVGLGVTRADLGFVPILVISIGIGALMGLLMGVLCLKVRGIYLLLLTLALAQALFGLAFYQVALTGGDNGIANIDRIGVPSGANAFYLFTLAIVAICMAALWLFTKSPVGMVITGLRESESRMDATGYSVSKYIIVVFIVSGAFSAIAGMLDTYLQGSVSPENFGWLLSAEIMIFAILGGAKHFMGPIIGAAIVLLLEVYTSTFTERWTTVLGVVYIVTALFLASGVLGLIDKIRHRTRGDDSPDADTDNIDELPPLTQVTS